MISNRLSNLSCSEEVFLSEVPVYQDALKAAGYTEQIRYNTLPRTAPKRNRQRKIIWFNPPFCQTVKTNVGAKFLALIDKHFKGTPLGKYFNRKTIKVSYSCLPNLDAIISGHNKKLLKSTIEPQAASAATAAQNCNCRGGLQNCPMNGNCLKSGIIYKAAVKTRSTFEPPTTYIGAAANSFKERYRNHTLSFKHEKYQHNTSLSKHIWNIKNKGEQFDISWSIAGRAPPYNPISKSCKLCLLEKTLILTTEEKNPLNKRSELLSKCRHRAKYLLSNLKT